MNRTEKSQGTNEDASIGIGAMIVFIALILVAAVASAVIIQTAEKLQQTAQQTGDDTASEQGTKIIVLSAIITGADAFTLTFELGAGSNTIADTAASWYIVCDDPVAGITIVSDAGDFTATDDLGAAGSNPASLVPGTAYELPIGVPNCDIDASTSYSMVIAVSGGGTTYEILTAGLSIAAGERLI